MEKPENSPTCPDCGGDGWRANRDSQGKPIWTFLMNDCLPCGCGALKRRYAEERAMLAAYGDRK